MKKKGFTIVELLSVLVVVAIIILLVVPAYGRVQKSINEKNKLNEMGLIEVAAVEYANDYNVSSIFVEELIINGYIQPNNKENIVNPADESDIWNCNVITITEKNNLKYAKFTNNKEVNEDKTCNYNKLNELNQNLVINMYEYNGTKGNKITNKTEYWTNKNVLLELEFKNEKYSLENAKVKWYEDVRELDKKEKELVVSISNDEILRKIYKAEVEVENNGKKEIFKASVYVLIDKIRPGFYSDDKVEDGKEEKWLTETSYTTKAYDDGSGIYGYKLSEENIDCNNTTYTKGKKIKIVKNGKYYICIKDIAGNTTEQAKELELKYIDNVKFNSSIEINGTKGEIVNNKQWYIKDPVVINLKSSAIGDSGLFYKISNTTKKITLLDEHTDTDLEKHVIYNSDSKGDNIEGIISNKALTNSSSNINLYYEKNISGNLVVNTKYDSISVQVNNVVAISGIKEYKYSIYRQEDNKIIETVLNKQSSYTFNNLANKDNEYTYDINITITSNAGNVLELTQNNTKVPSYCSSTTKTVEEKYIYQDVYGKRSDIPRNGEYKSHCTATVYKSNYNKEICSQETKYCNSKKECLVVDEGSCKVETLRDENNITGHKYMDFNDYYRDSDLTGTCSDCFHTHTFGDVDGWYNNTYYIKDKKVYEWEFGANSTCHVPKSNHPNC